MRRRGAVPLFLCAEALLYLVFLTLDLTAPQCWLSVPLKYLSIVLCLVMSIADLRHGGSRLVVAAMALTLLADAFLLVLDRHYTLGLLAFCGVQGLYLYRIYREGRRSWRTGLPLRLLLSVVALWGVAVLGILEPVTALTALYFPQLVANAVESMRLHPLGRQYHLFSAGLFLFICCDLCVGLCNLSLPASGVTAFARVGMWLFYLPSQVLITLSGNHWKGNCP